MTEASTDLPDLALSWVEIRAAALQHNLTVFRRLAGRDRQLMLVVKADAYGHGLAAVAGMAARAGTDWLAVFTIAEAVALREAGITAPVLVLGPTPPEAFVWAAREQVRLTLASPEAVGQVVGAPPPGLAVHVKLETGTNRQGFGQDELESLQALRDLPDVTVEGAYTHFADIEDTTDHAYARQQLACFQERVAALKAAGIVAQLLHASC